MPLKTDPQEFRSNFRAEYNYLVGPKIRDIERDIQELERKSSTKELRSSIADKVSSNEFREMVNDVMVILRGHSSKLKDLDASVYHSNFASGNGLSGSQNFCGG